MKRAILLSLVFALISVANAWSQTGTPVQSTKPAKTETEKTTPAEEKSDGAAYSGKGKGGDKDRVEKGEKTKNKEKSKKGKSKKGKKGKKGEKHQKGEKGEHSHGEHTGQGTQNGEGEKGKPAEEGKPNPKPKTQTTGVKNPKDAKQKPKTEGGNQ